MKSDYTPLNKSLYQIKKPRSWNSLVRFLSSLNSSWAFRGQIFDWDLKPTLERFTEKGRRWDFEMRSMQYLRELPQNIIPFKTANNFADLISFYQHYGGYTRFLDFTCSPYVAIFFAVSKAYTLNKSKPVVWAIDKNELNATCHQYDHVLSIDSKRDYIFDNEVLEKFVVPIEDIKFHERHINQQSLYLTVSNPSFNFEECLNNTFKNSQHIYKIFIGEDLIEECFIELSKMNINYKYLFPGIEGELMNISFRYLSDWSKIKRL